MWPSPQFYAGVAAVWIVILSVHFGYLREPAQTQIQAANSSPSPDVQSALAEQRRELAEMLGTMGVRAAASAPRPKQQSPRSELRPLHDQTGATTWHSATPESLPA